MFINLQLIFISLSRSRHEGPPKQNCAIDARSQSPAKRFSKAKMKKIF